jgi:hypothetical protein
MGRKKGSPQTSELPLAFADGLPMFCSARHFVRSSKVFVVPFWELPADFQYLPNSTNSNSSTSEGREDLQIIGTDDTPDCEHEGSEDENEDDSVSVKSSDDITSCSSDTASVCDDGLACIDTSWVRAMVDKRPLLFHRKLQPIVEGKVGLPSYSIGFSTALIPHGLRRAGSGGDLEEYMSNVGKIRQTRWSVFALDSGGHFAGAIFDGSTVVAHKTFKRYTSRAKQGGSQVAFDSQGRKAKSAGSNLRRYCHQRLGEEIHQLITKDWASEIVSCSRVFIAVSSRMRSMLVGTAEKPYIRPDLVFQLPFPIPRPTFEAVRSAYMHVSGVVFATGLAMQRLQGKDEAPERSLSSAQESCAQESSTPLHDAAAQGDEDRVIELLESGADPTVKDSRGCVPFELCASRPVRRAFRFWFDLHVDAWDWTSAGIPRDVNEREDKEKRKSKGKHHKIPSNLKEPTIIALTEEATDTSGARISSRDEQKGYNGCALPSFANTSSKLRRQEPKKVVAPKRVEARSAAQKPKCHATLRRLAR